MWFSGAAGRLEQVLSPAATLHWYGCWAHAGRQRWEWKKLALKGRSRAPNTPRQHMGVSTGKTKTAPWLASCGKAGSMSWELKKSKYHGGSRKKSLKDLAFTNTLVKGLEFAKTQLSMKPLQYHILSSKWRLASVWSWLASKSQGFCSQGLSSLGLQISTAEKEARWVQEMT